RPPPRVKPPRSVMGAQSGRGGALLLPRPPPSGQTAAFGHGRAVGPAGSAAPPPAPPSGQTAAFGHGRAVGPGGERCSPGPPAPGRRRPAGGPGSSHAIRSRALTPRWAPRGPARDPPVVALARAAHRALPS